MANEYFIGLDIGGTKVEGAIAALHLTERTVDVVAKKRFSVQKDSHFNSFITAIVDLVADLLQLSKMSINDIKALGAGLPGTIDPVSKKMINGNTRFLIGQDFVGSLKLAIKERFQKELPIFIQNDANLFAYAESYLGVGKNYERDFKVSFPNQVALGITLGTGVGGGLVTNGKILNGAHGSALEVGHMSLDPFGHECYCGQKGCSETYLSGTALSKLPPYFDSKKIFELSASDSHAKEIISDYQKKLVHFLSVLNNLFNPHYFVFGGGLSSQSIIFDGLKDELKKNIFLSENFCPEIYINQLGDSAGLFGAMVYAKENLLS